MLVSIILSNAYKGVVTSILTHPSIPDVTKNLYEVASSPLYILTLARSRTFYHTGAIKWQSQVQIMLSESMEKISPSSTTHHVYKKLNESIHFHQYLTIVQLFTDQLHIPEQLVFIDLKDEVEAMNQFVNILGANVFVHDPHVNFFSTRYSWIVQRNYVGRVICPYLKAMDFSGIFRRWMHLL